MRCPMHLASACLPSRGRLRELAAIACLVGALAAWPACAAVPWHPDIAQAKAASVISHRPVLIIFTAKWSEASVALDETTLANAEAMALVTACFEPVKIDVDADPETTRRLGVSYLPTACVIDLDDRVLATFDCPDNPASFVAAAGRAAQDAAAAKAASRPAEAALAHAAPPRTHSDFTAATPAAAVTATHTTEPNLPAAPPTAWPAERPAAPAATTAAAASPVPAARPSIDPAPATAAAPAAGMASWLGQQPAASAATPAPTTATPQAAATPSTASERAAKPAEEEKPKPANAFVAALQKPFAFLPKWPGTGTTKPAADTPASTSATPATAASAAPTDGYGSMPLGLEGYCPVTLVERGAWVEGRAQFGARHRGRTYLFAAAEQQQAFLADPDRYAPALSGDDPVLAFDSGKTVPGQRRYGVTYQSRVYLFSTAETRTAFTADPQKYTARVALAEGRPSTTGTIQR